MISPENAAAKPVDTAEAATKSASRTNPNLTANLRADYDAIRNDLQQAKELAADFQRLAADKSNEVAHIKSLLEKTTRDLGRLEEHVAELRGERHRLANELMAAAATELELTKVKKERDHLRTELDGLRQATMARINDLQAQVIEQRTEIAALEARARTTQASAETAAGNDVAMQKIQELTATVSRLMGLMEKKPQTRREMPAADVQEPAISEDDFINISFDR
jgi:chromosome segregation ATPase